MSPGVLLSFIVGYFTLLIAVSYFTSRKSSDNSTFFIANRNSKWYLVAFGMIGTAFSVYTGKCSWICVNRYRFTSVILPDESYFDLYLSGEKAWVLEL
jgi:uncharacterized membrane protein YdcZ (DUF606 family)